MNSNNSFEYSIARKITDESLPSSQQTPSADSEASLRENLAEQLNGAQNELSSSLIALRSSGDASSSLIAQGDAQLGTLLALKRQLAQASPATLAMVRAEIAACVATASSVARLAEAVTATSSGVPAGVSAASQAARSAVAAFERDMFDKKIFDPYLRFSSTEDEEAYRRREEERHKAIEEALKKDTPQGNLEANRLAIDQLEDAGAHGADKSPDYAQSYRQLKASEANLSAAVANEPTKATAQGSKPAADPLDTIAPSTVDPAIVASLKAAGVVVADQTQQGHGVTQPASPGPAHQLG